MNDELTVEDVNYYKERMQSAVNASMRLLNIEKHDDERVVSMAIAIFNKIATPLYYRKESKESKPKKQKTETIQPLTPMHVRTMQIVSDYVNNHPSLHMTKHLNKPFISITQNIENFDEVQQFLRDNGWKYYSDKVNKIYGFVPMGGYNK